MRIVKHESEIIYPETPENWIKEAKLIELAARNCYKSEDRITSDSWQKMVKMLKEKEHGAMLEFANIAIKITTDRGVTHELVRHRLASYAQESTRYCNYSKDKFNNEITVVEPVDWDAYSDDQKECWKTGMLSAEKYYFGAIKSGLKPENARDFLPHAVKADIYIKCNWRELLHILNVRTTEMAHPNIRKIFYGIQEKCRYYMPMVFDV